MNNQSNQNQNQNGFSLIEVLIALVVVSVGLLGLAGMQGTTLRNTHSTTLRSQALDSARDMIERMRTNHIAIKNGVITYAYAFSATDSLGTPSPDCDTTACNATEAMDYDHIQWATTIQNRLPLGSGAIAFTPATPVVPAQATITVNWKEAGDEVTDPDRTLSMDVLL